MSAKPEFETRNIALFFVITFAFSWSLWIPRALYVLGVLPPSPVTAFLDSPFNPAAFGPLVGALILTFINERGSGVVRLLRRGVDYHFAKVWWIPLFVVFPLLTIPALLVGMTLFGYVPLFVWAGLPLESFLFLVVGWVYILLLAGPLEEEFGWRGYALGRLQARFNATISTLILGFLWALWHLPLFLMPGGSLFSWFGDLLVTVMVTTFLFTWIYNNTKGSILACLVFHTMLNWCLFNFPVLSSPPTFLVFLVFLFVATAIVVLLYGYKRLQRERK